MVFVDRLFATLIDLRHDLPRSVLMLFGTLEVANYSGRAILSTASNLEQDSRETARVEIDQGVDEPMADTLNQLTRSLDPANGDSSEVATREELLKEFTEKFLERLKDQGFSGVREGSIPETTRLEIHFSSTFLFATVIYAAQQLVFNLGHGAWLTYGNREHPLHLCHQTVTICL